MVYYVEKLFVPRLLFNPIFMCINRNNFSHSFTSIGYELITACVYCYEIICAIPHQQLASHTSKAKKSSTSRSNNKNSINNNLNLDLDNLVNRSKCVCVLLLQVLVIDIMLHCIFVLPYYYGLYM